MLSTYSRTNSYDANQLIVYGFIRRIQKYVSRTMPTTLFQECYIFYGKKYQVLLFIQNGSFNIVNFNDIINDNKEHNMIQCGNFESLNKHQNENLYFGSCGNAYIIYYPRKIFAFIKSNVDLPNKILSKIHSPTDYTVIFQHGGKTWKTDTDCNAYIVKNNQQKDIVTGYRWKLPETYTPNSSPSKDVGLLYSQQYGLIFVQQTKKIYNISTLSLKDMKQIWEKREVKRGSVSSDDKIGYVSTMINDRKLLIVSNKSTKPKSGGWMVEEFDFQTNRIKIISTVKFNGTLPPVSIYYDAIKQRLYVIGKSVINDNEERYHSKCYILTKKKWYNLERLVVIRDTKSDDSSEICSFVRQNALYMMNKTWNDIWYLELSHNNAKWKAYKFDMKSFEIDKHHSRLFCGSIACCI